MICGRPAMELRELVDALLSYETLVARQWVADAFRSGLRWDAIPEPAGFDATQLAVAAGVVELLAARAGQAAPPWTFNIPAAPTPIFLVRSAHTMPRLRRDCQENGPEPLRRRGVWAPPTFL